MLQKIKDFWDNPYAAPLTQPLRNVGNFVANSVKWYTEAVKDAFDDRYISYSDKGKSRFERIYKNLYNGDDLFVLGNVIAALVVGGGAAVGTGVATYGAMAGAALTTQLTATGLASIAAATVGFVAAPVVTVVAIGACMTVAGTVLGVVPGVVGGAVKAYKHHQNLKNPPPAQQAAPLAATPTAKAIQDATVLRICDDFSTLPAQTQQAVIERLERSASSPQTPQQKMIKAIDGMTEEQRVTLAEMLEEKLASAFDAVASKRAAEAGTLDEDISVKPIATKLRRRNASPAGGTA